MYSSLHIDNNIEKEKICFSTTALSDKNSRDKILSRLFVFTGFLIQHLPLVDRNGLYRLRYNRREHSYAKYIVSSFSTFY